MSKIKKNNLVFFNIFLILILFGLDRISKEFVILYLNPNETVKIIDGIISFVSINNFGAAFGILQGQNVFLICFSCIILFFLILYLLKSNIKNNLIENLSFIFLISGTTGNLYDRIILGYITDFIKIEFVNFPVFNLADIFINLGICLIIGNIILGFKVNSRGKFE